MHLLRHKQAREARVRVEVEDRAHRLGPRGVSMSLHLGLRLQISR